MLRSSGVLVSTSLPTITAELLDFRMVGKQEVIRVTNLSWCQISSAVSTPLRTNTPAHTQVPVCGALIAGIAYEHDVEVQAVAGGIDHAVGAATDQVAEDGQKLEENGCGMSLSVGSDGADGESGETMEGGFARVGVRDGPGRGCARCFEWRRRVRPVGGLFGLKFGQKGEEFGPAPFLC
jgi:hypothetical protein